MADDALQRTIRRVGALLLVPLLLLVLQMRQVTGAVGYGSLPGPVTGLAPFVFLVGAVGYLILSALGVDASQAGDGAPPTDRPGEE